MKIVIGADHRGFSLKEHLKKVIDDRVEWIDVGAYDNRDSDYPDFSYNVVQAMDKGEADKGVLICGSGVGMAIAANRFKGIYAALVWDEKVARMSIEHDKANVLVLPSDFINEQQAEAMIKVWLDTSFRGGKYQRRIDKIDELGGLQ